MWKHGSCISIIFQSFSLDGTTHILGSHWGPGCVARGKDWHHLWDTLRLMGCRIFFTFSASKRQKSEFFQTFGAFLPASGEAEARSAEAKAPTALSSYSLQKGGK